ncbi:MAG: glycoside hydrolase family 43 protein [Prevotella sp.]|jgi:xylan 1,4-beta-xylosidase
MKRINCFISTRAAILLVSSIITIATSPVVCPARTSACSHENISSISNPILPGFNPDPSICRVGDDYYLVTSSFMFFPGLPVYHSRDLAHWKLIGHAINSDNIKDFHFKGLTDNDGIWAPTLRYHNGTFYIICTLYHGGGSFILQTSDPSQGWGHPVWIPQASGIDPTLFWDSDGRTYYLGNRYDFKHAWSGQVGIWLQEIDLDHIEQRTVTEKKSGLSFEAPCYTLKGSPKILSYGHATNARYAEGPHLYKIKDRYCLLMAEGGSGKYHAVTVHWSDSLFGNYKPQQINPVLTHRHLGRHFRVQNVGHADLVQLQSGEWMAVCLANRMLPVKDDSNTPWVSPLGRETWLCRVGIEDGQLVFAPGAGQLQESLPSPLPVDNVDLETDTTWYTPMTNTNLRLKKLTSLKWSFQHRVGKNTGAQGITVFRTVNSYYMLEKGKKHIQLIKIERGKKTIIAALPYRKSNADLSVQCDSLSLRFFANGAPIGSEQSMLPLCDDGKYNKFNGTGVGYVIEYKNKRRK